MMDDRDKGVLFKSNFKDPNHKDFKGPDYTGPDYTGKFNYNGTEFKIAGWKRTSAKGLEYISLMVDTYEPPQDGSGYDKFKQAGERFKEDVVIADVPDGEIDLSIIDDIPF